MRIIRRDGFDCTIGAAVSIVTDGDATVIGLRDMMVRLLEELTFTADDSKPVLSAQQLSRVLAYKFRVEED